MQWDGPGLVVETTDVLPHFLTFVSKIHEYATTEIDMELELTSSENSLEDKVIPFGIEPWTHPREPGSTKRDFQQAFQLQEDADLARAMKASLETFQFENSI